MNEVKRAEKFVKKDNEIIKGIDELMSSVREQMNKINDKTARYCMNEVYTRLVSVKELIDSAERAEFKGIDLRPFIDDGMTKAVEVTKPTKTTNIGINGKVASE